MTRRKKKLAITSETVLPEGPRHSQVSQDHTLSVVKQLHVCWRCAPPKPVIILSPGVRHSPGLPTTIIMFTTHDYKKRHEASYFSPTQNPQAHRRAGTPARRHTSTDFVLQAPPILVDARAAHQRCPSLPPAFVQPRRAGAGAPRRQARCLQLCIAPSTGTRRRSAREPFGALD